MPRGSPSSRKSNITAAAGYDAIEPWIEELDQHVKSGGTIKDIAKRLSDKGLVVPDAIGFAEWIVDDDARRKKGLEEAKRCMEMVRQIGSVRIAAPPMGATEQRVNLYKAAERYRALMELGDKFGVIPMVELWGHSKSLCKVGEVVFVAIECGHPKACVLLDVFHLYKGGSGFDCLKLLNGGTIMGHFHMNDYPAKPPVATVTDTDRVHAGLGVAPLKTMLRDMRLNGYRGMLSLELFNQGYWNQDPLKVATTGLEKMKEVVKSSLES